MSGEAGDAGDEERGDARQGGDTTIIQREKRHSDAGKMSEATLSEATLSEATLSEAMDLNATTRREVERHGKGERCNNQPALGI